MAAAQRRGRWYGVRMGGWVWGGAWRPSLMRRSPRSAPQVPTPRGWSRCWARPEAGAPGRRRAPPGSCSWWHSQTEKRGSVGRGRAGRVAALTALLSWRLPRGRKQSKQGWRTWARKDPGAGGSAAWLLIRACSRPMVPQALPMVCIRRAGAQRGCERVGPACALCGAAVPAAVESSCAAPRPPPATRRTTSTQAAQIPGAKALLAQVGLHAFSASSLPTLSLPHLLHIKHPRVHSLPRLSLTCFI